MEKVTLPSCSDCPAFLRCNRMGMTVNGANLESGQCYCVGKSKPRRIVSRAVRIRVPDWCPRRKFPCELRIYDFKSVNERLMHTFLQCDLGHSTMPEARRYVVAHEGHTDLTPRNFWLACNQTPVEELLGHNVRWYCIVEIDDGLRPYCFYRTEKRFVPLPYFKPEIARNNKTEDDA